MSSLFRLIPAIAVLSGLHAIDQALRGNFHWPLDHQSVWFLWVIGAGLTLSRRSLVGPRFRAVIGAGNLGLRRLSHFSPFTDQALSVIYHAYHSATAGISAVGCLAFLMKAGCWQPCRR